MRESERCGDVIDSVDWGSFKGPPDYRPLTVGDALGAIVAVVGEQDSQEAYDRMLFAIGNHHAGTLYPAAVGAVPALVAMARSQSVWTRFTALEILTDAVHFEGEPGFEMDSSGKNVKKALRDAICRASEDIFAVLMDRGEFDENRADALAVLDAVSADRGRIRSSLQGLDLDLAHPRLLAEPGRRERFAMMARKWLLAEDGE